MTGAVHLTAAPWQFVDVAGEPLGDVPERSRPALTFESDGQVYGTGGVNRLRSTYRLEDGVLRFGTVVSTRMAGTPEHTQREEAVLALLAGDVRVRAEHASPVGASATAPDDAQPGTGSDDGAPPARLDGVVLVLSDAQGRESRLVPVARVPDAPHAPAEPEPGAGR
ncbi:META domain-containing protein [Cellulomonas cellasea]|uniref:Heat shock protein HslJ n=1 Tax=Cellulomonas cellasea TaxID=43670 RepID=A0A7W4UFH6_9CELL|nr:META domain-containing protein [Cellulomonas cellasea]MBB2922849.1 heat shock protein HslJ [Cellulomonas cellasea]